MPIDRPTFSEHWRRVSQLRPRLRATVNTQRQWFRGQRWIVLQDQTANQFFRINEPGYFFIGLLDGKLRVADAWRLSQDKLGDAAPTQGEAIQLLSQLWQGNLLQADLPPDAESLFEKRRKRVRREMLGYLQNFLFVRIPLIDPDAFLTRWLPVFGRLFSPITLVFWVALVATGVAHVVGRWDAFFAEAQGALSADNLPLLYVAMAFIKLIHEFGHGFACKKFGVRAGTGGEVHAMGVMFLVFVPVPYVDATSSWALRSRRERIIVAGAGILAELAIASVAAIVWARSAPGVTHALAHNAILIASVSTLLFNGNPLLRYDGYYVLSDLLDIPNLAQRSKEYLQYLVRRWIFGVRSATSPAHTRGERFWFVLYGVASLIYRVFIYTAIALFVATRFFVLGIVLAAGAIAVWVLVPTGKFVRYLATNAELSRVRLRAIATSAAMFAGVVSPLALIPAPAHERAQGVVEPLQMAMMYAGADGFIDEVTPSGADADDGAVLIRAHNDAMEAQLLQLQARARQLEGQRRIALGKDVAQAQIVAEQISAINDQIARVRRDINALTLQSPLAGRWIAPNIDHAKGVYIHRGDRLGLVADLDSAIIRAVVSQAAARVLTQSKTRVEIKPKGRPGATLLGARDQPAPAGVRQLPSAALGYAAGGAFITDPRDPQGARTNESIFEVLVTPDDPASLLPGQRVVVRFRLPDKPLLWQWWDDLRRLLLRRLRV